MDIIISKVTSSFPVFEFPFSKITMKRRPVLYILNFVLPIWFLMCLDIASLFISEKSGEKLSFKITVMLSVTVLQLILKDILPSTSNKVPLIGEHTGAIHRTYHRH